MYILLLISFSSRGEYIIIYIKLYNLYISFDIFCNAQYQKL